MSDRKLIAGSFIFLFLVILIGSIIIVREKGFFSQEETPTFISYVGLWDPEIINPLKIEYQKQNPNITIEYEQKEPELYFETLNNLLATDNPPDIFWWHSGWGPMLNNDLSAIPEDIISVQDYEKTYFPVTKADAKIGGAYRGVPLGIDGLALIYNKGLLSSKGFESPPKTWADLQRTYIPALNKFDKKKGILQSTIALGTENNISNFSEILGLLFLQNGVTFIKNGELKIHESVALNNDNLGQKTLDFYASFTKKTKDWDATLPNSIRAFAQGKVAMIILPSYKIPSLQSRIKATGSKVKFGVASVPQPPNVKPVTWGSYWLSGVSVKSDKQSESWKFIKFLSEPENLKKIFEKESKIRKIGRVYPRKDMSKELRKNALLAPYQSQAQFAKSWYLHSDTFDGALNDEMIEKLRELVSRMAQGKGSAKSNLNSFAPEAKEVLSKYGVLNPGIIER